MRQLQTQEVQAVSGAGLLGSVLNTGVQAGSALGSGFLALGSGALTAGSIVVKPVVSGTVNVLKWLI